MKKIAKIAGIGLGIIVLAIAGIVAYLKLALPNVGPAPDLKVELTPERIAHGEYLANHVAACMDCHSQRDWSKLAAPPKPGTHGAGGDRFDQTMGLPGVFYARNITPAGVGDWTDGELFRAITSGVSKDGSPLFPLMPYFNYAQLDEEDVKDIIAYLRTIPAIENKVPADQPDFPMNFILPTIPKKAAMGNRPDPSDQVAYGAYLVNMAGCRDCHTPSEKGAPMAGKDLAGGAEFRMPDGSVLRPANLTPHETGLKGWTKEAFVSRFRLYADSTYQMPDVPPGGFQTFMPWKMYGGMKPEDLEAIYAYLRTVPPVNNLVIKWEPAPKKLATR